MKGGAGGVGFGVRGGGPPGVWGGARGGAPRALDRRVVELSDPAVPTSRQPYHAVMGATGAASRRGGQRPLRGVTAPAPRSGRRLLRRYRPAGPAVRAAPPPVGRVIAPAPL